MNAPTKRLQCVLLSIAALSIAGCGYPPPVVVQATGVVKINGEPLPNAVVSFIPVAEGRDSSHIAEGITDSEGKFTLSFYSKPGVCEGLNKVTLRDKPVPDEARSLSQEASELRAAHRATLLNRPIPKRYQSVGQTPLSFEVTGDQKEYLIEITR